MSARTKVQGNRAIRCDAPDCQAVYVAAWWGNGAAEARAQAQSLGWSRDLARGGKPIASWVDLCPEHSEPEPEPEEDEQRHNVYRDGEVHVLREECASCIFKPHERPVDGARVAGMVRDTADTEGATVVCHSTLYQEGVENAVCRGWWDRLADRDPTLRLAKALGVVVEDDVPAK